MLNNDFKKIPSIPNHGINRDGVVILLEDNKFNKAGKTIPYKYKKTGHKIVHLVYNNHTYKRRIANLLYETFIGSDKKDHFLYYLDGDNHNQSFENLAEIQIKIKYDGDISVEEWKRLEENPKYMISNWGNARYDHNGVIRDLLPQKCTNKYLEIKDSLGKHYLLHRLVAKYFIQSAQNHIVVNHLDYDVTNNRANNLEYTSQLKNTHYSCYNGRDTKAENHGNSKLNWEIVNKIRDMYKDKISQREIGRQLNICYKNINQVVNNHTWKI